MALFENVDAEGNPVPAGEPGAKAACHVPLQSRAAYHKAGDLGCITIDSEPCSCGRTLARARAIEGRIDDVLKFVARNGGRIRVHPIEFGIVTRDREVREFQVLQEGPSVRILVVPRPECGRRARGALPRGGLAAAL